MMRRRDVGTEILLDCPTSEPLYFPPLVFGPDLGRGPTIGAPGSTTTTITIKYML